ncbi:hypothetical protein A0J51_00060 [Gluconobacter japonicus]|nr:hypothetical protein A0J51_00060 [Gluconobacter japonicus]
MDLLPGGIPFSHKDKYRSDYNTMTFLLIAEYPLARKRRAIGLFFRGTGVVYSATFYIDRTTFEKSSGISRSPDTFLKVATRRVAGS